MIVIGPGLLVAATGVGAGDLLTASMAGSAVGTTILWAAVVGAILKWFMNEGIARWQMATGTTILEGWFERFGPWIQWWFLAYLLVWSVFTGGALVSACGVAGTGLIPLSDDPKTSKILWGTIHSVIGCVLVYRGGFKLFSRFMSICIAIMFACVIATAVMIQPDWTQLARDLMSPKMPDSPDGAKWVLGVLGGVGGTLTLLSYGYWIRERDRSGLDGLKTCRIDLAVAYLLTAAFGVSMLIIGSRLNLEKSETVALDLAGQLSSVLGEPGRWIFLIGFWGAVFSSLLGVWQSVPYMFADFVAIRSRKTTGENPAHTDLTTTRSYRAFLLGLSIVPLPMLAIKLQDAQLAYAVFGSLFMPFLAVTLLIMNNNVRWVGSSFKNRKPFDAVLLGCLLFFGYVFGTKLITVARSIIADS
jgi:Mn2+/Fe2+ NRAMP family transporter